MSKTPPKGLIGAIESAIDNGVESKELYSLIKNTPISKEAGNSLASRLLRAGRIDVVIDISSLGCYLVCKDHDGVPLISETVKHGHALYLNIIPALSTILNLNHLALIMKEKELTEHRETIVEAYINHCGGILTPHQFSYLIRFAKGCRSPQVWSVIKSKTTGEDHYLRYVEKEIELLGL